MSKSTTQLPLPLFVLHGERAKILAACLEAEKRIIMIQDQFEGEIVVNFYTDDDGEPSEVI